jgi:hypothetical protein
MIKIYCSGPIQLLTDHSMGHSDVLHLERYVMTFLANGNKPTTKKKLLLGTNPQAEFTGIESNEETS